MNLYILLIDREFIDKKYTKLEEEYPGLISNLKLKKYLYYTQIIFIVICVLFFIFLFLSIL